MLCDRCGQREATIHEVLIQSGSKLETHLCESCAASVGKQAPIQITPPISTPGTSQVAPGISLGGAFGLGSDAAATHASSDMHDPVCPDCGREWASVRRSGQVGCPGCYEAFEERLGPLIERAHEGGACHVGKSPKRRLEALRQSGRDLGELLGDEHKRAERMRMLREQLGEALVREQYERAAQIRDQLGRAATPEGGAS